MKKLVALYKTYRGGEWFSASLESVRLHCAGVMAVTSALPWKGLPGTEQRTTGDLPENCCEPLHHFQLKYPDYPVDEWHFRRPVNSDDQYRIGLALIRALHGKDCGVLVIDTDEIWESNDLARLKEEMTNDHTSLYFRSGIKTYARSPFYRVAPLEKSRVVVGLANPDVALGDSRFSSLGKLVGKDKIKDVPCSYHHMGYVRLDPEEFVHKLSNTSSQDAVANRPNWKQEVWDKLPHGKNIHPAVGYSSHWGGVEEIPLAQLPPVITEDDAFWATAGHQAGSIPTAALTDNDPMWRAAINHISIQTTVPSNYAIPLCAALRGKMTQDRCIYVTPRLRMSFRETVQLAYHAAQVPMGGSALEIGSGLGGSIAIIGSANPYLSSLIAVDPYIPYDEQNLVLDKNLEVGTVADFQETIERCGVKAELMRMTSSRALNETYNLMYDLILVDGNHSYDYALFDLVNWWTRLKPGGTMLLHDMSARFPGVREAAKKFEGEYRVKFNLPYRSSLAWVKK